MHPLAASFFGTDGIRGLVGQWPVTPLGVYLMGKSLGRYLRGLSPEKFSSVPVVVGRDTRESGPILTTALCHGLAEEKIPVVSLGIIPTPGVSFVVGQQEAQLGVMVSASHNPYTYNGLKIMDATGAKLSVQEEQRIFRIFQSLGEENSVDALPQTFLMQEQAPWAESYGDFLVSTAGDLEGLSVVVDGANGACASWVREVWCRAGATVVGSVGVTPNGQNINDGVGSVYPMALQEAVVNTGADLGICLDGDGDRILLVDRGGCVIDGDQILACLALALRQQGKMRGGVAGTITSNPGLQQFLKTMGIPFLRTGVGDRLIMEALEKNDWILGGETCGHILRRDLLPTGDGCAAALCVANYWLYHKRQKGSSVGPALFPLFSPWPACSSNVAVEAGVDVHHWLQGDAVRCFVADLVEKLQSTGGGRVIVRPSGTEPYVRILVDGACGHTVEEAAQALHLFLSHNMPAPFLRPVRASG